MGDRVEMQIENTIRRIVYYDFLKLIAAIMVVFYHLGIIDMAYSQNELYIPNINRIIMNLCQVSVPLFFMVNGAILLNRDMTTKTMIKKSIKMLIIYIFWSKIIGGILNVINLSSENISINSIFRCMVISDYSLWFLRTLSILYIIYPFIKWLYNNRNKLYLAILLIGLFIFPFLYNYLIIVFKILKITLYNLDSLPRTGVFTLYSILYFIAGGLLANYLRLKKDSNAIKKNNIVFASLFIIGIILSTTEGIILTNIDKSMFDGVNSSFATIGAMFMSFGVFYFASRIEIDDNKLSNKVITFFGNNAIGIYIFHLPYIYIFRNIIHYDNISLVFAILVSCTIVLISSLTNNLIMRIPCFKWLLKS